MKKQLFNENWKFKKIDEEAFADVTLPHDAMFYEKRSADAPSGDAEAFFHVGMYRYEKEFECDAKNAFLGFDGVYKDARVFLNGELKGEYHYGYSPFVIELGEIKGKNTIAVECGVATAPDSRWYPGAGIYRDVFLYTAEEDEYIKVNSVKVSTLDYKKGLINVRCDVNKGEANIEILDGETIAASAKGNDVDLVIPEVKLWDENDPFLYTVRVSLGNDVVCQRFGVRQVVCDHGLYVNGKKVLLKGGCIHSDNGLLGAASYYKSEYRRVKILKQAGFNAIRCAHNPASAHLLDACDELGVYVMDEAWDMWFHHKTKGDYATWWRQYHNEDLKNMVDRDFNHPSVIMYSIGNEVSEPAKPEGLQVTSQMVDFLHELDPNRLVTGGFNLMIITNAAKGKAVYNEEGGLNDDSKSKQSGMNSTMFNMIVSVLGSSMNKAANSKKADAICSPSLDKLDICGYNYASGRYAADAKLHPDRVIFGSETMPYTIGSNWKMVEDLDNLVGDFMWTAWDYIGENGIGAWSYTTDGTSFSKPYPWWLADTGAFDIIGTPNAEAHWAMAAWHSADKPMIDVQPMNHDRKVTKAAWRGSNGIPSYSWKGCDGRKMVAEVFTDGKKVDLYQNGKKVGSARVKEDRAKFKLRYVPGTLEAVAFDENGNEKGRSRLLSASDRLKVAVRPEEESIRKGDIVYVAVNVEDDRGIIESNADRKLKVEVENGELLAFGSAAPRTLEDLHSGEYTTYYGRAMAIVRADCEKDITVKVICENNETKASIKVR